MRKLAFTDGADKAIVRVRYRAEEPLINGIRNMTPKQGGDKSLSRVIEHLQKPGPSSEYRR
jgi:hypothetical protein